MIMSGHYKKRKHKNYNLIILTVFAVALVVLVIFAFNKLFNSKNPNPDKDNTGSSSVSSEDPVSSGDTVSGENTAVSLPAPQPVSYEERVGKKYAIDITDYLKYIEPENKDEYLFLVSKSSTLSKDYVPTDLTDCIYTRKDGRATQKLRLYAEKSLEAMMKEMETYNLGEKAVTVTSAYRSYSYQNTLFNQYCNQHQYKFKTREECEAYVMTFSNKPGTSEHQSGLCLDMHNISSAEVTFAKTKSAQWLADNCYRFGFILRYPEDKQDITGITYEPWHFRYVGRENATQMHEKGMCLEEYLAQ